MVVDRTALRAAAFAIVAGLGLPTAAQEALSEKFEIELGQIPKYPNEEVALTACAPDGVVWADRKNGFYYPKFFADYGRTKYGAFTCHQLAVKADYWSLTPASDGGHKGREFPLIFCDKCS